MIERMLCVSVVTLIAVAGCSSQSATRTESATQTRPAAQAASEGSTLGQPQAAADGSNAAPQTVTGTVLETMNAASYTYVRVKSSPGEIWAATGQFEVAVGDRVVVPLEIPMVDFHSQSLNRDFPLIYFVGRITREGEPTQPATMPAHGSTPLSASPAEPAQPMISVAPAAGGMTVADVWAKRKSLGGKAVTIRGKVVKFNGDILNVNWVHLQDGTGIAKDGTNDITVTSKEAARVGDVVTVTGKIALDKDLGSGYAYPVLLEDATIVLK